VPTTNSPGSLPRGAARVRGFSILELSVVVGIISLVAAIALPIGRHLILRARAAAVENDLRVFAAAFQSYAAEHGDWPQGDGTPGAFPAGMEGFLGSTSWQSRSLIGGHYTWDPNSVHQGSHYRAAIVIESTGDSLVSTDLLQLQEIDRNVDDGDLAAGNFLLGYRDYPVSVLEH
jgi:prepilin-type N-terminal cleavage/methylation domain-containing protein